MPIKLAISEVKRGRVLTLNCIVNISGARGDTYHPGYNVSNIAEVGIQVKHENETLKFSITMRKLESALDSKVKLNVMSKVLNFRKEFSCGKYMTVVEIGKIKVIPSQSFPLKINLFASKTENNTFAKLYDDTDLTDFYLSTGEGKVAVHRACIATHSDVFKKMLLGSWKEKTEGKIKLKGFTLQTLQQLKTYIYLGDLPDDVRPLLLLAKCYLLDNLKEDCMRKLAFSVNHENLYEFQTFACENNLPELSCLLLQLATDEVFPTQERK